MTPVTHDIRGQIGQHLRGVMLESVSATDRIAATFVAARLAGRAIAEFPGNVPASLADAYEVQDAAIARMPERIGGWKVGRIPGAAAARFGADRLAGPIFVPSIVHDSPDAPAVGRVFERGFGAAEAEFVLRIGTAPPEHRRHYSLEDAAALVDRVHVGIEIASSPLATINDLGPTVIVADFGNNHGLVIGPEIPDWRVTDYPLWPVSTHVDGMEVGRGTAAAFPDGPLGSVRFLLELAATRGIRLAAGTWVSSGAVSGVHDVRAGQLVEARFGTAAVVRCRIETVPHA